MPQDESRGVRVAGTGHGSCQESFTRGWKLGPEARARLLLLDFAKTCQPRVGLPNEQTGLLSFQALCVSPVVRNKAQSTLKL